MRTVLRWMARLAAGLAVLVLGAAIYVYVASERAREQRFDAPLARFSAPADPEAIHRGERLAIVHGCTVCHGAQLQGRVMFDEPRVARITAPNIPHAIRDYSDSELERLLRRGVKRDGVGVWVMPAATHLADDDLGALIAFIRTVEERGGPSSEILLRAKGRIGVATGQFQPSPAQIELHDSPPPLDRTDALSLGRYLVASACIECHGRRLEGTEIAKAPSLLVAAAYDEQQFQHLMRTGVGLGGRDLGKMSAMGRERFFAFTEEESRAVFVYLQEFVARGGVSPP